MNLHFRFTYGTTDLSHSAWLSDDITNVDAEELRRVLASILKSVGTISEILDDYSKGESIEESWKDYYNSENSDGVTCEVCKRSFASPGNLKQHKTVKGHNGA